MIGYFYQNILSILLVILFFGGSILVHELGHYIAAKKMKMFVPRFSIGFGPKVCGFKHGETEFIISLFPLGGYVAIPQLADLSMVEGEYDLPKNLKNVSAMNKVVVAFCGPLANIIFALFLAIIVRFIGIPRAEHLVGTEIGYVPATIQISNGAHIVSPAYQAGLRPGDKVLSVDNNRVHTFEDIVQYIALGSGKTSDGQPTVHLQVSRNDVPIDIEIIPVISDDSGSPIRRIGIYPAQKLTISKLSPHIVPENLGVLPGDVIVSANNQPILHQAALHAIVTSSDTVTLTVQRNEKLLNFEIPVTTLPVTKPFLTFKLHEQSVDIVPFENDSYQIFFEDKKFKNLNGATLINIDGTKLSSLSAIEKLLTSPKTCEVTLQTKNKTVGILFPQVQSPVIHDVQYEKFLGLNLAYAAEIWHPGVLEQLNSITVSTVKTLGSLFNRNSDISVKHLSGPVGIVRVLYSLAGFTFGWFLWYIVLININLAILNLLPLPVLDGGQIVIAILSKIFRSKYIEKFFSVLQTVFFALLLGLIIYVTFFDCKRIWSYHQVDFETSRQERIFINHEL